MKVRQGPIRKEFTWTLDKRNDLICIKIKGCQMIRMIIIWFDGTTEMMIRKLKKK